MEFEQSQLSRPDATHTASTVEHSGVINALSEAYHWGTEHKLAIGLTAAAAAALALKPQLAMEALNAVTAGVEATGLSSASAAVGGTALLAGGMLAMSSRPAAAWNSFGHMTVGDIAYEHMTPEAKERAMQLIELNPSYDKWKSLAGDNASDDETNRKIFSMATTWADDIKGDKSYHADGTHVGNTPPDGPIATQNIGYADKNLHKYWHFDEHSFSTDGTPVEPTQVPNAATQIEAFRKTLASDAPDELKSYDLTWMLHLVGDIHQPLHATARVDQHHPNGDVGGNFVKIECDDCPKNLHELWDQSLGPSGDFTIMPDTNAVQQADANFPPAPASAVNNLDAASWGLESFNLAKQFVYKDLPPGDGPFQLTDAYRDNAKAIAQTQAELAGERLAKILNTEMK